MDYCLISFRPSYTDIRRGGPTACKPPARTRRWMTLAYPPAPEPSWFLTRSSSSSHPPSSWRSCGCCCSCSSRSSTAARNGDSNPSFCLRRRSWHSSSLGLSLEEWCDQRSSRESRCLWFSRVTCLRLYQCQLKRIEVSVCE